MSIFSLKPEAFGLDISDFSLKIAKLDKQKNRLKLISFGEEKIPAGVIEKGEVRDEERLAEIIIKARRKAKGKKIRTSYVISSLPEERSFLDVIQIPLLKEEEIEEAVKFEIENHIPLRLEEVYFDSERVPPVLNHPKYQEILIAATPKNIVEGYVNSLKLAGLQPRALEVECLAIVRALIKKDSVTNPLLIIDFGSSRTTFIIYSGKSVRFTSTISFSSQNLTEVLSQKLKIPPKKAETLKQKEGLEGKKEVAKALTLPLNKLVDGIKNQLDYYRSHEAGDHIFRDGKNLEKVLLCGGGSNLKGLTDFLAERLKIEVALGNPWTNILTPPLREIPGLSYSKSLGYTTALGLAQKEIYED